MFTVLTRDAAEDITFIHERMPVILPSEVTSDWLNPKYHGDDILKAAITQMKYESGFSSDGGCCLLLLPEPRLQACTADFGRRRSAVYS